MKMTFRGITGGLLACFLVCVSGCGNAQEQSQNFTPENEIISFEPIDQSKRTVRVSVQSYINTSVIKNALEKKFPDHQFIFDYNINAGDNTGKDVLRENISGGAYDFVIATENVNFFSLADSLFLDLSSEKFINHYLLSSLNALAINDRIYAIPGPYEAFGIAYNKDLFQKNGWKIPETAEDFFALCRKIKAAGIRPFATDWKYSWQMVRMLQAMSYENCFSSPEALNWYDSLIHGKATFKNHAEPMFRMAQRLFKEGMVTEDDFTASLTKQRIAFFNGQIAMIDYGSEIYGNAKDENCPFEIGFIPYPGTRGASSYIVSATVLYAIPRAIKKDPERLAFAKSVFDYLSSMEGQDVEIGESMSISNVTGYKNQSKLYQTIQSKLQSGDVHHLITFAPAGKDPAPGMAAIKAGLLRLLENGNVDATVDYVDSAFQNILRNPSAGKDKVIAQATRNFSMLETSYYLADKIREATGAQFGVMLNGGYFRSNFSFIRKGPLTARTDRFIMQGVSPSDYLTTYRMTGKDLKTFIEHPYINGKEVDQFAAVSGLKIKYAPWHSHGNRVLSVTEENGEPLEDTRTYTVAAYAGAIDPRYISDTLKTHEALGSLPELVERAYSKDKIIAPDISRRVTLVWDKN